MGLETGGRPERHQCQDEVGLAHGSRSSPHTPQRLFSRQLLLTLVVIIWLVLRVAAVSSCEESCDTEIP